MEVLFREGMLHAAREGECLSDYADGAVGAHADHEGWGPDGLEEVDAAPVSPVPVEVAVGAMGVFEGIGGIGLASIPIGAVSRDVVRGVQGIDQDVGGLVFEGVALVTAVAIVATGDGNRNDQHEGGRDSAYSSSAHDPSGAEFESECVEHSGSAGYAANAPRNAGRPSGVLRPGARSSPQLRV